MTASPDRLWIRTAAPLGIGYALVGILFALPASHAQAWRLAAWGVSALGFGAHIAYERFRLRNSPGRAALHVALAAALGAFGLAVAANIHAVSAGPATRMTTLQVIVMTCAYAIVAAAAVYFTRATPRRIAGALAGGAAAACWGLGAIMAGEALGLWRDFLPSAHGLWVLFYFGLAISLAPIYLITWRVARRFGLPGLMICLIVAGVVGPPRDYLYVAAFPEWGAFGPGIAPVLADSATYVGLVALGHVVMWLVSGPADETGLARSAER